MTTIKLKLTKPAKKSGGDRYECTHDGETIVFYFPQTISRENDKPVDTLTVTISK